MNHADDFDPVLPILREEYNPPPPTPAAEMWAAIEGRLDARAGSAVTDIRSARRERRWTGPLGWAAAASLILAVGVGIGRMSAPGAPAVAAFPAASPEALVRVAAVEHLSRTEPLLRMARADGRTGRVDPAMGSWARGLLGQTRLLLDSAAGEDPAMRSLLEDLELVLIQMAAVADVGGDEERIRSELGLALSGMEQRGVLTRIQAVVPQGSGMAGI